MSKNNFWAHFGKVMHLGSVILCLVLNFCYLLAVLSPYITPKGIVIPAFFGMFFPVFLLLQVLVLLYWLIRTKWWWVSINALILIFSFNTIRTYVPYNNKKVPEGISQEPIRILSYNVMSFGFIKHTEDKPNDILQYIKDSGADIVCLQEAQVHNNRREYVSERIIEKFLPEYKYRDYAYAQAGRGSKLILLSKWPIRMAENISYPSQFNGSRAYTVDIRGREVLVVNNHLESFRLSKNDSRRYLRMAITGKTGDLKDQVSKKLGPAFRLRAEAADAIHRYITKAANPYTIVCGDFNDTPISYTHYKIGSGLIDAYRESAKGLGFSYNRDFIPFRIDYILHSTTFRGYDCLVDNTINASDHYPIGCTLYFKDLDKRE